MTRPSDIKPLQPDALYKRDIQLAHAEGKQEGRSEVRQELISFLQKKYLDPSVERGSDGGKAILEVTRAVCEFLQPKR